MLVALLQPERPKREAGEQHHRMQKQNRRTFGNEHRHQTITHYHLLRGHATIAIEPYDRRHCELYVAPVIVFFKVEDFCRVNNHGRSQGCNVFECC